MLTRTLSCLGVPCLAASFLLHPSLPLLCEVQRHGFPGVDVHVFEGHYSTGLGCGGSFEECSVRRKVLG